MLLPYEPKVVYSPCSTPNTGPQTHIPTPSIILRHLEWLDPQGLKAGVIASSEGPHSLDGGSQKHPRDGLIDGGLELALVGKLAVLDQVAGVVDAQHRDCSWPGCERQKPQPSASDTMRSISSSERRPLSLVMAMRFDLPVVLLWAETRNGTSERGVEVNTFTKRVDFDGDLGGGGEGTLGTLASGTTTTDGAGVGGEIRKVKRR